MGTSNNSRKVETDIISGFRDNEKDTTVMTSVYTERMSNRSEQTFTDITRNPFSMDILISPWYYILGNKTNTAS